MANNYTSASFTITVKDTEKAKFHLSNIRAYVDGDDDALGVGNPLYREWLEEAREAGYVGAEIEVEDNEVWFHHYESINMTHAVAVARILLDLDENEDIFTAEWADTCSRARVGEFGGGAVAFSRHDEAWESTGGIARQLADELRKRRG